MTEVDKAYYGKDKAQGREHDDTCISLYGLCYFEEKARYTIYNKEQGSKDQEYPFPYRICERVRKQSVYKVAVVVPKVSDRFLSDEDETDGIAHPHSKDDAGDDASPILLAPRTHVVEDDREEDDPKEAIGRTGAEKSDDDARQDELQWGNLHLPAAHRHREDDEETSHDKERVLVYLVFVEVDIGVV